MTIHFIIVQYNIVEFTIKLSGSMYEKYSFTYLNCYQKVKRLHFWFLGEGYKVIPGFFRETRNWISIAFPSSVQFPVITALRAGQTNCPEELHLK